ncbi:MAG: hypothetical protein ABI430_05040 [Candidatus Taylorbacteria bacterium]
MQRRSIEELRPEIPAWPRHHLSRFKRLPYPRFRLRKTGQLYFYGTSVGIGPCAGIQGMNIGVLGLRPPGIAIKHDEKNALFKSEYFVLLRPLTLTQSRIMQKKSSIRYTHEVELLHCPRLDFGNKTVAFVFEQTGRKAYYVWI